MLVTNSSIELFNRCFKKNDTKTDKAAVAKIKNESNHVSIASWGK